MRIAVMLRSYDRPGGIGIYCRNIVKHLLNMDKKNRYLLIFASEQYVGNYRNLPHAEEIYVPGNNPVIWDQWHASRTAKRWGADLIFNTKFSVPVFSKAKKVMVLHGASWFVHPELYTRFDILYVRATMPLYCRNADFLISNSDLTTNDFKRILKVPDDKIETIRLAAAEYFTPITEKTSLDGARRKFTLPNRFVLTVTSYDPRKNFSTLLNAFERVRDDVDVHLVIAGKNCERYAEDYSIKQRGLGESVHFLGWTDQEDLPSLYNLAEAFVFPSVYEEFGIPVVEAMSCGCPVVGSDTGALPELTDGAALLCEPFDDVALADNLRQILTSKEVAEQCRRRGLERAKRFSWAETARETLEVFDHVCAC